MNSSRKTEGSNINSGGADYGRPASVAAIIFAHAASSLRGQRGEAGGPVGQAVKCQLWPNMPMDAAIGVIKPLSTEPSYRK